MIEAYKVFVSTLHAGDLSGYLGQKVQTTSSGSHDPLPREKLIACLQGQDGLVAVLEDRIDEELLKACPTLKVVANVAVGYDNIDVPTADKYAVLCCNTPGVLDDTTADLSFALLLAAARRLVEADAYVRAGKWQKRTSDLFLGTDIHGKTLGIIGLGRIGQAMARRALGFGMRVIYSQRNRLDSGLERELKVQFVALPELLQRSDFISIHCPLTPNTRHLLSDNEFAQMKPECFIVNAARGAIIDEAALVRALTSGKIKGAGLDVFENEPQVTAELLNLPNVVVAPHMGSASIETRSAMARLAADGVLAALSGKLPVNAINPQVWPKFAQRLNN